MNKYWIALIASIATMIIASILAIVTKEELPKPKEHWIIFYNLEGKVDKEINLTENEWNFELTASNWSGTIKAH